MQLTAPFDAWSHVRALAVCGVIAGWPLVAVSGQAGRDTNAGQGKLNLTIGFSGKFFADVQESDALAAVKVWATELKKERGFEESAETFVFDGSEPLLRALRDKQLVLVLLMAREYLAIREQVSVEPRFVGVKGGATDLRCLLVVHARSPVQSVLDLKGQELLVADDPIGDIGRVWLENLVMENTSSDPAQFFSKVRSTKSSQALLPVFFRQAVVSLVPESSFDALAELNPQLKTDLRILAASPRLLSSVICVRPDYEPTRAAVLIDSLSRLHTEPRGQQILTLFKTERLVPFEPSYLESTSHVLARNAHLKERLSGKAGGA